MKVLRGVGIAIAVVFLGLLGLIVLGIVVSSGGSRTTVNNASVIQPVSPQGTSAPRPTSTPRPTNTPLPTATPIPVISLHIGELKGKYDANQVAADAQYKGRWMEIEGGTIRNITPGVIRIDAVGLEKEWLDLWSLACRFDEVDDNVLSVSNGDVVTVVGLNSGMSWGSVDLRHCKVTARTSLEANPAPTPTATPDIPATITALIQPTIRPEPSPMPSPTPSPLVLTGRMGQVTPEFQLEKGKATFTTIYQGGGRSDITVYLRHSQGQDVALIAHGWGYFDGPTTLFIEEAGSYVLDIQAGDGIWTITIEQ